MFVQIEEEYCTDPTCKKLLEDKGMCLHTWRRVNQITAWWLIKGHGHDVSKILFDIGRMTSVKIHLALTTKGRHAMISAAARLFATTEAAVASLDERNRSPKKKLSSRHSTE